MPFFGAFRDYGNVNMRFRCYRYGPDFPGFAGKDLDPARYQWLNQLLNGARG